MGTRDEQLLMQENITESYEILKGLRDSVYSPSIVEVVDEKIVIAAGAYTAGDVVSNAVSGGTPAATPWRFENVVKELGGAGRIIDALILAETTAIASVFSLFIHNDVPTCELDDADANTAFLKADRGIAVVRIDFTACDDVGTGMSESTATPSTYGKLPKVFVCRPDSRDLWGVLAIQNAVDLADNTTLTIKLWIERY